MSLARTGKPGFILLLIEFSFFGKSFKVISYSYHSEVWGLGEPAGHGHRGALVRQQRGVVRRQEGDVLQAEHPRVNLRQLRPRPS